MNKLNIITEENMIKLLEDDSSNSETLTWNGIEFTITKTISFESMLDFVNTVAISCSADESQACNPEIKGFLIAINVIERYTNLNIPSKLEDKYDLVYRTNLIPIIIENIDARQYREIKLAIDEKIQYLNYQSANATSEKIKTLLSYLESVQAQLMGFLDGVGGEDIKNMISAMTNEELSASKVVEAYLKGSRQEKSDG